MLDPADLLRLPFTPDLSEAGISFACRSLAYSYSNTQAASFIHLRGLSVEVAAELAFRRYLHQQGIPFSVRERAPLQTSGQYDISLGGHRCGLRTYFISHPDQIELLAKNPAALLQAPALIPLDELAGDGPQPDDLYLFAFVTGTVVRTRKEVQQALASGGSACLIQPLPAAWSRPSNWISLGELSMKSEAETALIVEVGGLDERREFVSLQVELPPRERISVKANFYSLAYVRAGQWPPARLGLHSPVHPQACILQTGDWGNIRVNGMEIVLTGWSTHAEFRQRSSLLNPGKRTFQFNRTRLKNMLMPVSDLNPLPPLLERVKEHKRNP